MVKSNENKSTEGRCRWCLFWSYELNKARLCKLCASIGVNQKYDDNQTDSVEEGKDSND